MVASIGDFRPVGVFRPVGDARPLKVEHINKLGQKAMA